MVKSVFQTVRFAGVEDVGFVGLTTDGGAP